VVDVACRLRIPKSMVYKLEQDWQIPTKMIGGQSKPGSSSAANRSLR
jgi:hypothetical protein